MNTIDRPLVQRLRAEGSSALRRHLSVGMHALCTEAAERIVALEQALVIAEAKLNDTSALLRRAGADLAVVAHQVNQVSDPRSSDAVFTRE